MFLFNLFKTHVNSRPSPGLAKFKHSGDLGDIVFSLPAIQALGGGTLYLDPQGGLSSPLVKWANKEKTKLNLTSIKSIAPFLEIQDCIKKVRIWDGEPVDYDLDLFRKHIKFNNLSVSHLSAFGLNKNLARKKWLTFPTKRQLPKPYLIARSVRYIGNYSFWESSLPKLAKESVFIGFKKDYEIFQYTFDINIDYYETPTILDLAETINSCERIYCNAGLPHAIAEGLHKELVCEIDRVYSNVLFKDKLSSTYV